MKELPTLPLRTARAGSRRLPRIAACGLIFASACVGQSSDRSSDSLAEADLELAQIQRGKALANRCAICHLEPDPSLLPKQSWSIILGDMGLLLGIEDQAYFESQPGFARVSEKRRDVHRHFGLLPPPNLISATEWIDLKRYYLATAPDEPLPAQSKPPLAQTLDRFAVIEPKDPLPNAFTTLVRIRPEAGQLLIGDSGRNTLSLYDADGKRIAYPRKFRPPITPVDIAFDGETAFIASIGDVSGADMTARPGFITQLDLASDPLLDGDDFVFAKELPRLADLEFADLDGDGINDLIASGFGTAVGEIALFRNPTSAAIADPQTLLDLPGAVKTQAFDFNSDGRLDVAALLGNAREGFHILENQGELGFRNRVVFQTHPGMGHTYFELQDFDNDGRIDLLVVNGDNVDSDPYNTYKNYHGIRIYLNQGDFRFDESYFYPMRGAFVARAADFDQDGDLDIAAISFYPDFESPNPEAFVYLENAGRDDLDFRAYTTPKLGEGRWMTMDAGDIDGDGDIDLALGGAYVPIGMSRFPEAFERLSASGPAFLILRNQTAP